METSKISNAIDAAAYTRHASLVHFNMLNFGLRRISARENNRLEDEIEKQAQLTAVYQSEKTAWCKAFFSSNFPRLLNTRIGRVLMGVEPEDKHSYAHKECAF